MASLDIEQVAQFASLFPEGEVPRFPQHRDDLAALNVTQQAKVRASMPALWEQLHGGSEGQLPADVLVRMHRNELKAGDEQHLRAAGLETAALALEADIREGEIQASFARMEAEREARAAAAEQQRAQREMKRLESIQLGQMQAKHAHGVF